MTLPDSGAHHLTSPGAMLGTVAYMSPEQVKARELDARTDLFSFGAVLYEMATGEMPFNGASAGEICGAILRNEPKLPSQVNRQVSPGLEAVIRKGLEKDRNLNYQSAAEMRTDLQRPKRDSDSQKLVSAIKDMSRVRRRGRFPVAIAIVSILAILVAISIVIYRNFTTRHLLNINAQNMKMTRLTDSGKVGVAAISGDGRYIAYSLREPNHSLWVQQIAPESKVRIVPPSPDAIQGVTFSPGGSSIYFVRAGKGYVIPTLGGTPKLLIEDSFAGIGVSPDGTKPNWHSSTVVTRQSRN